MGGLLAMSDECKSLNQLWLDNKQASGVQQDHWAKYVEQGLPTVKHEDWKYTSLESFKTIDFVASPSSANIDQQAFESQLLDIDAIRFVFVDGQFDQSLSKTEDAAFEFAIVSSSEFEAPQAVEPEIFLHLNEALAKSVLTIKVKPNVEVEKPIHIVNIDANLNSGSSVTRQHIDIAQGASVNVVEQYLSLNPENQQGVFHTGRLSANVGNNASFEHYCVIQGAKQSHHFSHNDIIVGRDARINSQSFLLSGHLIRRTISTELNGNNAYLRVNSLSLPQGNQTFDTRTYLEHNSTHCDSEQLHKIIATDQATAVFNGMIKVAKGAIQTDGQMDNHNLLLSEKSQVNTKPQLEINADDVKCSHGTTTGAINQDQVFYLMARGISRKQAEKIVTMAFANEVTDFIEVQSIRDVVVEAIDKAIQGSMNGD